VGLGWGTRHGVWVDTGQVSWTDEDVGSLRGVNVTPGPIWMAHEWPMTAGARVSATLLVEQGWSQLISLCPPSITPSG
jgi:hypothetical protein